MIEVRLFGPFSISAQSPIGEIADRDDINNPGLIIWTFEFNQAHRMHEIDFANHSIKATVEKRVTQYLQGERALYGLSDSQDSPLELKYKPTQTAQSPRPNEESIKAHLSSIRFFYAAPDIEIAITERVANALVSRVQGFGGTVANWLSDEIKNKTVDETAIDEMIRFHRPAFIAALPDDMNI